MRDIERDERSALEVRIGKYHLPVMNWIYGGARTKGTSRVDSEGVVITRVDIDAEWVERRRLWVL